MVRLDLDEEEAGMLAEVVASYLSDLRMEIADTDDRDFRESLKKREAFLGSLTERLAG